ncbi:unnamed protein product [Orchesella dallaii]|uniref:Uncharacterized protein n=1 Tax=Orchesella dallaii TaxID=48710 RepID=A0ABP1QJM0_9HEXA
MDHSMEEQGESQMSKLKKETADFQLFDDPIATFLDDVNIILRNEIAELQTKKDKFRFSEMKLAVVVVLKQCVSSSLFQFFCPISIRFRAAEASLENFHQRWEKGVKMISNIATEYERINPLKKQDIIKVLEVSSGEFAKVKSYFATLREDWDSAKGKLDSDLTRCIYQVTSLTKALQSQRGRTHLRKLGWI